MTSQEEHLLLLLYVHFKCTYADISNIFRSVFGSTRAIDISGYDDISSEHDEGKLLMEAALYSAGITKDEIDEMVYGVIECRGCGKKSNSLHFKTDIGLECERCSELKAFPVE